MIGENSAAALLEETKEALPATSDAVSAASAPGVRDAEAAASAAVSRFGGDAV